MPPKKKKSKGKKGGSGADAKVRKYLTDELNPWLDKMYANIMSFRAFICDIEAVVYRPGSPQALAATQHCGQGGTIDGGGTPPPPPKF